MKNKTLLTAFAAIFLFCSCKKDNGPSNTNGAFLPKTYTEEVRSDVIGNSITTYNLTYDADGRLLSLISTDQPPVLKFIYQYSTNNSFTLDLYNYDNLNIHEIFWLNNASMVDSTFQFNDTNDSTTEKYIYNSNNQLTEEKTYDYFTSGAILSNVTDYTYDDNGNVISQTDNQGKTTTFDYYTDLNNTLSMGQAYYSRTKNLPKTVTLNDGGDIETGTHFYTFDSNKRLVKDSITTTGVTTVTAIKTYTY